ncbi:MAG TPA: antitoxin [Pseudonocardia sp.]|uniref:antitoxin n=1 Tax=Pseudonocardia sp. TaxID=60912 RepID=UPI002CE7F6E7|nr:antitoxin [Pseudonocardia sp.]HTF50573.1 antitoxin [Pseudonocardia sp.]
MNADDIIKQGRELAGKLRDGAGEQVAQHEQQIKGALGKVVNFVNDKTHGKYSEQVSKAVGYVEHGVDLLASDKREGAPGEQAPGSASAEGQPPPAGATPSGGPPPGAPTAAPAPPPPAPAPPPPAPATPPPAQAPPDTPAAGQPSAEPRIDPKGPPASG